MAQACLLWRKKKKDGWENMNINNIENARAMSINSTNGINKRHVRVIRRPTDFVLCFQIGAHALSRTRHVECQALSETQTEKDERKRDNMPPQDTVFYR